MRLLLGASADVDLQAQNGCTALHNAAANGHEPCVELLISHCCDVDVQNSGGATALHVAATKGKCHIAYTIHRRMTSTNRTYGWGSNLMEGCCTVATMLSFQ